MIEHSCERCLREEGDAGLNVRFWEKPDGASIKNNATSKREHDKFNEDEPSNLEVIQGVSTEKSNRYGAPTVLTLTTRSCCLIAFLIARPAVRAFPTVRRFR